MRPNELPLPAQLMNFITGHWISKPIYAAAELGIADLLADGPKNIETLALITQSHASFLYRMMRALARVGIFSETSGRRFELTPLAECLQEGAMKSYALMFQSDWNDKSWRYFLHSVKTGDNAFEKAHGMPVQEWLDQNPGPASIFNEANAVRAADAHRAILEVYDFSGIGSLTDVGGGVGMLLAGILRAHPGMTGVLTDVAPVIEAAKKFIHSRGIDDRCQAVVSDFFYEIPSGSDAYLMSNILHDWTDDQCGRILNNCHQAMSPSSRLLIVEMVVPPGNQPSMAKLLDLEMMVTTGGRERTESEFNKLLSKSGFKLSQICPAANGVCVIEGIPL